MKKEKSQNREQTTIRLPTELKEKLQREKDRRDFQVYIASIEEAKKVESKKNRFSFTVLAIIVLYAAQILNLWTHQNLHQEQINHSIECHQLDLEVRRRILELEKEILYLKEGILKPLEEIIEFLEGSDTL